MARKAVQIDSHNTKMILLLTSVYINAGEFEQAISVYKKVLKQIPDFAVESHRGLGWIYNKTGNYEQAIWHYKQAIDLDSLDAQTYHLLGYCYRIMGEYEKSLVEFKKCTQLKPEKAWKYIVYGHALSIVGSHEESITECKKALSITSRSWLDVAFAYFFANSSKEAIEYIEQAIKTNTPYGWDYLYLAQIYLFHQEYKKGIHYIHTFLEHKNFEQRDQCYESAFQDNQFDELSMRNYLKCIMNQGEKTTKYPVDWSLNQAIIYAYIGYSDKAFEALYRAYDEKNLWLAVYIRSAFFDNLKSDPRYNALIKKLKLEKYITK